jgi:acetylornithine aminotransferase
MNNLQASKEWQANLLLNYGTPEIHLVKGDGCEVWDGDGNKYLDFLGGIATNALGHSHPEIVKAVQNQITELNHVSNFYSHPQVLSLAKELNAMTGTTDSKVFFCNSGTEANEAAIKISRLTGKRRIVSALGSFHGRTMGSLSITGQKDKREPFKPLLKKIEFVEYNNTKDLKKKVNKKTAMLILEPIQGEKGVIPATIEFLQAAREFTLANNALLAIDAVQTGMGRTGEWFGFEHAEITPDLITLAKGLGGGSPIGAVITIGKTSELLKPGMHGSTFGGNPIAAAAANATIATIKNSDLLSRNFIKGERLKQALSQIEGVQTVRGSGLLLGIVLSNPIAKEILNHLGKQGILVNAPDANVIRIAPAYVVTDQQIETFISEFRKAMAK